MGQEIYIVEALSIRPIHEGEGTANGALVFIHLDQKLARLVSLGQEFLLVNIAFRHQVA